MVLISQPRMLMAYGFVARVFEAFERHRTPVDLIATSEVSVSLTVDDPERLAAIQAELAALGEVRVLQRHGHREHRGPRLLPPRRAWRAASSRPCAT